MIAYFNNIWAATTTVVEGLSITASHWLRRPITIQYPDRTPRPVKEMLPERSRGLLDVDLKICTACTLCEQICPIRCIAIGIEKRPPPDGTAGKAPQRLLSSFDVDVSLCMFCGFCTEVCPTGAIHFTREFERATPDLADLVFHFVAGEPIVPYKPTKASAEASS